MTKIHNCLNCDACMEGTSNTGEKIYECYYDVSNCLYIQIDNPQEHCCESYINKNKANEEQKRRLETEYPEIRDVIGKMDRIDFEELIPYLAEIEEKRSKKQKIRKMPRRKEDMPEEVYKEYRKIAGFLVEIWNLLVEDNPVKLLTYARNRLDYNDRFEMFLKEALIMLTKKKEFEDRFVWLITEESERSDDTWDLSIFHVVEQALWFQHEKKTMEDFIRDAARSVPDDKASDFEAYMRSKAHHR